MILAGTNHSRLALLVAAGLFTAAFPCPTLAQPAADTTGTASASTATLPLTTATLSAPAPLAAATSVSLGAAGAQSTATAVAAPRSTETASARYFVDEPIKLPAHYQEAPELARLVEQGKLPPVKERLPEHPAVVEPVDQIGQYGGDFRKLASASTDVQMGFRLGYEPLVRWDRSGQNVIPGIAESWEMRDGGRTFVFHLRKGMKWSDGMPLTSADFVYGLEKVLKNPAFAAFALPWLRVDNELPRIEAPDESTVIYKFKGPYGNFPRAVASSGLQHDFFCPKHYLQQFDEDTADPAWLKKQIADAGFVTWVDFFMQRIDADRNPDLPTVNAFVVKVPYPNSRVVAERNPYYYKVDPQGNQLPYMDRMVTTIVFDQTVLNLKVLNGEVDFQMRKIDAANFTMFKEKGKELGYRTLWTPSTNPTCIYVNQYSRNEEIRGLLQDRRFRLALSHAINRPELVDLIYTGLAVPSSGFTVPDDPYYFDDLENANIEYDPPKSNALLDELGMKRRKADNMRTLPSGRLFSEVLHIYPSEEGSNADLWQLVVDYWHEVGLHFVPKAEDGMLSFMQATTGNSDFWTYSSAGLHWEIDGVWKAPVSNMSYMAPLYGNYYKTNGREGVKPPPEMQQLVDWSLELRATPSEEERLELGRKLLQQWADQCYVIGICRPPVLAIVSNRLKNVPETINYDYRLKSPGHLNIEQFYIDEKAAAK